MLDQMIEWQTRKHTKRRFVPNHFIHACIFVYWLLLHLECHVGSANQIFLISPKKACSFGNEGLPNEQNSLQNLTYLWHSNSPNVGELLNTRSNHGMLTVEPLSLAQTTSIYSKLLTKYRLIDPYKWQVDISYSPHSKGQSGCIWLPMMDHHIQSCYTMYITHHIFLVNCFQSMKCTNNISLPPFSVADVLISSHQMVYAFQYNVTLAIDTCFTSTRWWMQTHCYGTGVLCTLELMRCAAWASAAYPHYMDANSIFLNVMPACKGGVSVYQKAILANVVHSGLKSLLRSIKSTGLRTLANGLHAICVVQCPVGYMERSMLSYSTTVLPNITRFTHYETKKNLLSWKHSRDSPENTRTFSLEALAHFGQTMEESYKMRTWMRFVKRFVSNAIGLFHTAHGKTHMPNVLGARAAAFALARSRWASLV